MMIDERAIKDHNREFRLFFARLSVASLAVLVVVGLLLWRYYQLQVIRHSDFVTRSENNRVHVLPVPPTRGLIYDRNGVLLADNRVGFSLSIVVERAPDREQLFAALDQLLQIKANERERFESLLKRRKPYEPVPLRYDLSEEEQGLLAVNEYRLPGVEITAQLVRHYPMGALLGHVLGYVGRINDQEIQQVDPVRYSGTHVIGKSGIEKYYEERLMGQVGYEYVETNARGRVMRLLERIAPVPGEDLHLYLDIELQRIAYEAFGDERGAIAVLDTRTGGVLALVSKPGFDPNPFVTGISHQDYRALQASPDQPLFDRVLQGQYPPGSTVKPAFGFAALDSGAVTEESWIYDPGFYRLENSTHRYRDWKRGGHGKRIDLHDAIVQSCDTYFYSTGFKMGIDSLYHYGIRFGYGKKTGIDLPSERPGLMPSRDWKRGARGVPWYPGDTVNTSIGQGFMLATPLQMAVAASRLATRGEIRSPKLVRDTPANEDVAPPPAGQIGGSKQHWDYVLNAMRDVVHSSKGTAKGLAKDLTYTMAGKTGTAQVVGIAQGEKYDADALHKRQRDHALFVAFAPAEDPQIALAIIVENGEHGSVNAQPIAKTIFDAYLSQYLPEQSHAAN